MQLLANEAEVDAVFEAPIAILYKHSTRCPLSMQAYAEVAAFAERETVPVYILDVIRQRPLAQYVSRRTAVPHHSPQVLLLRLGTCDWHASHYHVTAEAISRTLGL